MEKIRRKWAEGETEKEFLSLREKIESDLEKDDKREEAGEETVDLQGSMRKLHQVFLDMAVMVEIQGERIANIEENVEEGRNCVNGGTDYANQMKKKKSKAWIYSVWAVLIIVFLVLCAFCAGYLIDFWVFFVLLQKVISFLVCKFSFQIY